MPDATSFNASSSPLATLLAVGGTGVSAQTGVQGAGTNGTGTPIGAATAVDPTIPPQPDAFQAMLNTQAGPIAAAASLPQPIVTPSVAVSTGDDTSTDTATAPVLTTIAARGLSGNLPVGGKILPVGLTLDDGGQPAEEQTPVSIETPQMTATKAVTVNAVLAVLRPLKNAESKEPAEAKTDATNDTNGDEAVTDSADQPVAPAPDAAGMMAAQPAPVIATAQINSQTTGRAMTPSATTADQGVPTSMTTVAGKNAPMASRTSTTTDTDSATSTASASWIGAPVLPGMTVKSATPAANAASDQPSTDVATTKRSGVALATKDPRLAAKPVAQSADHADTIRPGGASSLTPAVQPEITAPILREAFMTASDNLSASSHVSLAASTQMDATTGAETSRDMSALVDRLVETRAALRSGTPAQWVQTSVQHAEFGRVALQIRQDGDNLSVAMSSNDPGFAPAAQAALQASHSLLQPAAAQTGTDTSQDNRQPGQQGQGNSANPYNDQTGNPASNGQNGGQANGQQARQQPVFVTENQPTAPQAQPKADTAPDGSARSGRTGILA